MPRRSSHSPAVRVSAVRVPAVQVPAVQVAAVQVPQFRARCRQHLRSRRRRTRSTVAARLRAGGLGLGTDRLHRGAGAVGAARSSGRRRTCPAHQGHRNRVLARRTGGRLPCGVTESVDRHHRCARTRRGRCGGCRAGRIGSGVLRCRLHRRSRIGHPGRFSHECADRPPRRVRAFIHRQARYPQIRYRAPFCGRFRAEFSPWGSTRGSSCSIRESVGRG